MKMRFIWPEFSRRLRRQTRCAAKLVSTWVEGVGVDGKEIEVLMVIIITHNTIMLKCASFQFIPNTELLLKTQQRMCEMQPL